LLTINPVINHFFAYCSLTVVVTADCSAGTCYCKHCAVLCQLFAATSCLGSCAVGVTRTDVCLSEETERTK